MRIDVFAGIGSALGNVLTDGLRYSVLLTSIVDLSDDFGAELAAQVRLEIRVGLACKHDSYAVFPCLPNESVECSVDLVSSGLIRSPDRSLAVSRANLVDVEKN